MTHVAALKFAGSAPARLVWPTAVVRAAERTTVLPWRHSKSTTPRSVTAASPAAGFSSKLVPPWRADIAPPTARKPELAPLDRSTHCLLVFRYCRRKLMYIFWLDSLSPGIEPRIPTVLGWSAGSHRSIVAHSSCDCSSLRSARVVLPDFAEADGVKATVGRSVATAARTVKIRADRVTR